MAAKITRSLLLAALTLSVSLATPAKAANEEFGLVLGALGGGLLGHQFGQGKGNTWATAVGAVAGSLVGTSVGRSLDRGNTAYYARPSVYQHNPYYNGGYYQPRSTYMQPEEVYYVPSYERRVGRPAVRPAPVNYYYAPAPQPQRYCREYQQRVNVGSRVADSYGQACLQPDGSWEIVNNALD